MPRFVGGSGDNRVRKFAVDRTINMIPVRTEASNSKAPNYLASIPGLAIYGTEPGGGWPGEGTIPNTSDMEVVWNTTNEASTWNFALGDRLANKV